MKRLSQKDLIIALGIAVAVIIIVSSLYFKDNGQHHDATQFPERKVKPTVLIKKALEKLHPKAHI